MVDFVLEVGDHITSQTSFWRDEAKFKAFVGGVGSGKTFAGAVELLTMPAGSTGMVIAPTYQLMKDASQKTFFEILPEGVVATHNKTDQRTLLTNGVEIYWRSSDKFNNLRGPNLGWIWADEWAFAALEAHKVVMGRLRRRPGKLWVTTTPDGHNWLYNTLVVRALGWSLHYGATADNPYLLSGYLEDLEAEYADDPNFAAQELLGRFVDQAGSKRLPGLLVEAVAARRVHLEAVCPEIVITPRGIIMAHSAVIYDTPVPHGRYVVGADPAEGLPHGDESALAVLAVPSGELVAILAGAHEPTEDFPAMIAALSRWYNNAYAMVERNNHGHAVIGALGRHGTPMLSGDDGRKGWRTTAPSKAELYRAGHALLLDAKDGERVILPDAATIDQIKGIDRVTLRGPGKGRIAKVDDKATAWVLAAMGVERIGRTSGRSPAVAPVVPILEVPTEW